MRGTASVVVASWALLGLGRVASGDAVAVEVQQTAGYSTADVRAVGTQVRVIGDAPGAVRFNLEGAWGTTSGERSTDAFGAAYPYGGHVRAIEAYGERIFQSSAGFVALRGGRYRTPFGISSGSDHAYQGFLRAPLIRYDGYYALSNNFLEHGGDVVAGNSWLSLEASVSAPADVGASVRRDGLDAVGRGQAAVGPFILGASHIETQPYYPATFAHGRAAFTGVDVRWMHDGVQLRGEWIWGRPFSGTRTTGGYADLIVHKVAMGPVTLVARAERLDYEAKPPFAMAAERYTAGARVRLVAGLSVQANWVHQTRTLSAEYPSAFDVGVTYAVRSR